MGYTDKCIGNTERRAQAGWVWAALITFVINVACMANRCLLFYLQSIFIQVFTSNDRMFFISLLNKATLIAKYDYQNNIGKAWL